MNSTITPQQGWDQPGVPISGSIRMGPSNGLAIAALTCGVASMATLVFGFPGGLVAVALGIAGLVRAKALPGRRGAAMAKFGIATGVAAMVLPAIFVFLFGFMGSRASTEFRQFDTDISNPGAGGSTRSEGTMNSDPPDGSCDFDRFIEDPDC